MQNSEYTNSQISLFKNKFLWFRGGVLLATTLLLMACAQSSGDDGHWASGEPDAPIDTPDAPNVPESPSDSGDNTPLIPGLFFAVLPKISQLAHGPGQTWNGCESTAMVKGGYDSDTKCGNGTLHPNYAKHLNANFFRCVEKGAIDANYRQPYKVFLRHLGTYVNRNARNSSSLSMHAYARAIDITKFILYDQSGVATHVSAHVRDFKGATAQFYNSFRQCWKESMPSSCRPGQREYVGSIGIPGSALGGNNLHNDHIHLSYPLCAG